MACFCLHRNKVAPLSQKVEMPDILPSGNAAAAALPVTAATDGGPNNGSAYGESRSECLDVPGHPDVYCSAAGNGSIQLYAGADQSPVGQQDASFGGIIGNSNVMLSTTSQPPTVSTDAAPKEGSGILKPGHVNGSAASGNADDYYKVDFGGKVDNKTPCIASSDCTSKQAVATFAQNAILHESATSAFLDDDPNVNKRTYGRIDVYTLSSDDVIDRRDVTSVSHRPLVILIPWLKAKRRHVHRYCSLYLQWGMDVMHLKVSPMQILRPLRVKQLLQELIALLKEKNHFLSDRPIVVHGLSIGAFVWGQLLLEMQNDANHTSAATDALTSISLTDASLLSRERTAVSFVSKVHNVSTATPVADGLAPISLIGGSQNNSRRASGSGSFTEAEAAGPASFDHKVVGDVLAATKTSQGPGVSNRGFVSDGLGPVWAQVSRNTKAGDGRMMMSKGVDSPVTSQTPDMAKVPVVGYVPLTGAGNRIDVLNLSHRSSFLEAQRQPMDTHFLEVQLSDGESKREELVVQDGVFSQASNEWDDLNNKVPIRIKEHIKESQVSSEASMAGKGECNEAPNLAKEEFPRVVDWLGQDVKSSDRFVAHAGEGEKSQLLTSGGSGLYQAHSLISVDDDQRQGSPVPYRNPETESEIQRRMVCVIMDSPTPVEAMLTGIPSSLSNSAAVQATARQVLASYLRLFSVSVTSHYVAGERAAENISFLPTLMLYSSNDDVAPVNKLEEVIIKWRQRGLPVQARRWEDSPHVGHFRAHPEEYKQELYIFLSKYCKINNGSPIKAKL